MPIAWYVYIIQTTDDRLYTGVTTDMKRRWQEHSSTSKGLNKGAKFFRGRKPQSLVFLTERENRSMASKEEATIKSLPRKKKLELIDSDKNRLALYSELKNLRRNDA